MRLVRKPETRQNARMSTPAAPPTLPAPPPQVIPADTVYAALGDPTRRRILQILVSGKGLTATTLAGNVGKRLDATLKHLVALRGAGLVITADNPQDGRRLLYHLAPSIPVTKTEHGWELDFGYCLVRC
jgi:DNA-binding transcriptional ArsR family regulator